MVRHPYIKFEVWINIKCIYSGTHSGNRLLTACYPFSIKTYITTNKKVEQQPHYKNACNHSNDDYPATFNPVLMYVLLHRSSLDYNPQFYLLPIGKGYFHLDQRTTRRPSILRIQSRIQRMLPSVLSVKVYYCSSLGRRPGMHLLAWVLLIILLYSGKLVLARACRIACFFGLEGRTVELSRTA